MDPKFLKYKAPETKHGFYYYYPYPSYFQDLYEYLAEDSAQVYQYIQQGILKMILKTWYANDKKGLDFIHFSGQLNRYGVDATKKIIAGGDTELMELLADFIIKEYNSKNNDPLNYYAYLLYNALHMDKKAEKAYKRVSSYGRDNFPLVEALIPKAKESIPVIPGQELKELFTDDFSSDKKSWELDPRYTSINNGKMKIAAEKDKTSMASHTSFVKPNSDFYAGVNCIHTSGIESFAYGMLIGSGEHQLRFYIAATGFFEVFEGEKLITLWTKSSAIKEGNNVLNHLELYRTGPSYKFYVNGILLYEYNYAASSHYDRMAVSLFVSQEQTVEFDEILVKGTYQPPMYVN